MSSEASTVVVMALAFAVGGIPFGLIIGWARGVDPRATGSGNIGAANVARSAGLGPALVTLFFDGLKGTVSVLVGDWAGGVRLAAGAGCAAVLGHVLSPFLGFRGGKGVATAAGVFLVLSPFEAVASVAVFALVLTVSKVVSAASLFASVLLPIGCLWAGRPNDVTGLAFAVAGLVAVRHTSNLRRMVRGQELRVGRSTSPRDLGSKAP